MFIGIFFFNNLKYFIWLMVCLMCILWVVIFLVRFILFLLNGLVLDVRGGIFNCKFKSVNFFLIRNFLLVIKVLLLVINFIFFKCFK